MQEEMIRLTAVTLLAGIIALTALMLYIRLYRMARIYNWNGERYCYLGSALLRRWGGSFEIRLGERMVDISRTTLYRVCLSPSFCTKNRYKDMFFYACGGRRHLVVDTEPMQAEIL